MEVGNSRLLPWMGVCFLGSCLSVSVRRGRQETELKRDNWSKGTERLMAAYGELGGGMTKGGGGGILCWEFSSSTM